MFHFDFDVDDHADDVILADPSAAPPPDQPRCDAPSIPQQTFSEINFDSLLEALPTKISYSFISPTRSDAHPPDLKIARRDLFDARFQLISEGSTDPECAVGQSLDEVDPSLASALEFIDDPSDLVPSVYEGGLKTWECSLDLASCLKRDGHAANARGGRVLEVGCGTAIPTLCILQEIFASSVIDDTETHVHLQDYNTSVLKLVTMPNIILAWYTSPAADAYRSSDPHASEDTDSELYVTPQLLAAFNASLRALHLHLRFFSGSWHTFDLARTGGPYHLVLSSETIYHPGSLPSLVRVLREACGGDGKDEEVEGKGGHAAVCLVAAKTVYFGVGGGTAEFARCVESTAMGEGGKQGRVETVWENLSGVRRCVMRVRWR